MTGQEKQPATSPPCRTGVRLYWGWLLLLAAGGIGAVFLLTAPTPDRKPSSPRRPLVTVETLRQVDHCVRLKGHGRVEPVNRITLIPQVSGRVQAVHANFVPGGRIGSRQTLIALEQAEYQAAVQEARANLKTAEEELRLEVARQRTAVAEWEQFKRKQASEAQRDLATRGPQKRIKEAAVEAAQAALRRAQLDLRRTRIAFDFPVVIESIAAGVGSVARAGEALGVAFPLDRLWVQVSLPVENLGWFSVGSKDRVQVWPRGQTAPLAGAIREIRPDVERQGSLGQILVEVDLSRNTGPETGRNNPPWPLRVGEFVRVALEGQCLQDVFVLPRRAVRGNNVVWLVDDQDRLDLRPVAPLFSGPEQVLVRENLRPGERLITSQLSRPVPKMTLRVAPAGPGKNQKGSPKVSPR